MKAVQVLSSLRGLGVKLWIEGDRLQYSAPKGVMTNALRADLVLHKAEITEFLLRAAEKDGAASRSIPRAVRGPDLPLSFAQQRLWFLDQLVPENPFYNEYIGFRFRVPLNAAVLERSLNEIVRRHEALRTTFHAVDGQPVQRIAPSLKVLLAAVDLRSLPAAERETETVRLATAETQRGFDLTTGPLLRATLVRLGDSDYAFLLVMHHIISDTWSMGIFFRELTELYQAFVMGRRSPFPELAIQYADFAVWQRELLQGSVREAQLSYWKTQLAKLPVLQLPTDRPRPSVQTFRGARHNFQVSPGTSSALKRLSQREGVTLFMTLLSAFQTLLHRYTHQDDIVIGSFIAGRNRAEIEDLIGFFINTQVLRTNLAGDPTFTELLARVREVAMGAYANQDLSFEMLVEELQPERDLSRNPLFQAVFQLQNVPTTSTASSASGASALEISRNTAIFDLVFHLWDGPQEIGGGVEYSTDLFDGPTIERMTAHFTRLLEAIAAEPGRRISEFPLLGARERSHLLTNWNNTWAEYPSEALIHELFEQQVERTPNTVAVASGGEQVTFADLNARANQLAHRLRRLGTGPEVLAGVFVERSVDMVVALLGVLKAGGTYVPLDPTYPKGRLTFMLENAKPAVVLTHRWLQDRLPAHAGRTLCLDDNTIFAAESVANPTCLAQSQAPAAYVIYTSGSTGNPKGIAGLHRGAVNRFCWMWNTYPFEADEVCCQKTSLSFVDSIWEIFGPLLQGVSLILIAEDVVREPGALVETLAQHGITRIVVVPSLLNAMIDVCPGLGARLPRLRYWTSSGEALSQTVRDRFFAAVPHGVLLNIYGSSEISADATWAELNSQRDSTWVPIGRPIANTRAYILDDRREPVPIGVPGQLHIGGDGLARGYLHDEELTGARFIDDPFTSEAGARLYKTGDLAKFLPDGNIVYLGRIGHQIKIRGFRIELEEIETVLRQHQRIKEVAIGVSEDSTGDKRLTAYVVEDPRYPKARESLPTEGSDEEQKRGWQMVWDETYRQTPEQQDPTFNITGWNSIYTGLSIPAEQMREWVDGTVEQVLCRGPRRVLEIGCGTGLLLFRIAPHCISYTGTDFSPVALSYVRKLLSEPDRERQLVHVRLQQRLADDFAGIDPQTYDAVILNSVVQYFPNVDYLLRVLAGAVNAVAPSGFIFVGDVRSLPVLRALHTSVEVHRAQDSLPIEELRERIEARINGDQELVIDPAFFHALREQNPRISSVQVQMKRGRHHNELTQFRYDVVLHIDSVSTDSANYFRLEWNGRSTIESTREFLEQHRPDSVLLTNVPNARLVRECKMVESLSLSEGPRNAGELRALIRSQPADGIDPEEWFNAGKDLGYAVVLDWSDSNPAGSYAVLLRRGTVQSQNRLDMFPLPTRERYATKAWSEYVNNPVNGLTTMHVARTLREFAEERLPEYMVPGSFVLVDALPRTPNGKLDRRALPDPATMVRSAGGYVAPTNPVEEKLVEIWTGILNVPQVGIRDNFFMELGGHSLLATRLMVRIRDAFQVELPLRSIFEAPTIEGLARLIAEIRKDVGKTWPAPIPKLPREQYRVRAS